MLITVTPTEEVHEVDGTPCRRWEAITSYGVRFRMFVACVTCDHEDIPTLEDMGLVRQSFEIDPPTERYREEPREDTDNVD